MGQALLIAPYPIDGYPPEQYQARLLADEGYEVTVLTAPMRGVPAVRFSYPGIHVVGFTMQSRSVWRRRLASAAFAAAIIRYRIARRKSLRVEIAYDPIGVWFSQACPGHNHLRVAHLHEALVNLDKDRLERAASQALRHATFTVVADADRAELLHAQVGGDRALVVRNLPMRADAPTVSPPKRPGFSVVYFGSMGMVQALDTVVRSMPAWPADATLHLYGHIDASFQAALGALAGACGVRERVHFQGWVPLDQLPGHVMQHNVGLSLVRPINDNWRWCAGASNKRYQYLQMGLPQITDDAPRVRELIEGCRVGKCVSPEDSRALGEAVSYYHASPEACRSAGMRGQALVEDRLHYEADFRVLMDLLPPP